MGEVGRRAILETPRHHRRRIAERHAFLVAILNLALDGERGVTRWATIARRYPERVVLSPRDRDVVQVTADDVGRALERIRPFGTDVQISVGIQADIRYANDVDDIKAIDDEDAQLIVQIAAFGEIIYLARENT